MKKNNFISRKIFIASYLLNWRLALGLSFLYVYASLMTIFISAPKPYHIAPINQFNVKDGFVNSALSGADIFTNSTLGFAANSCITLILIYIIFLKEFKSGKSSLWLMSPFSRQQILYSKILFIWSVIFIMFTPQFVAQLIITCISPDGGKYVGLILFKNFSFLIYQLVLTSSMILVSAIFYNYTSTASWINIAIIVIIWFLSLLDQVYQQKPIKTWVNYLLISNLSNTDCLRFKNPDPPTQSNPITNGQLTEVKVWLKSLLLVINCALAVGLPYASVEILKRKDSNYC